MTILMTIIPCGILLTIMCSCTSYKVSWHPTPPLHGRSLAMFVSGPGLAYVIKPIRNLQLSNLLETILQNGIWCFGKTVFHWKKHPIPISTSWRPGMAACIWADPPADLPGTRYGAQSHQICSETKALEPTIVSWEESQLSASWGGTICQYWVNIHFNMTVRATICTILVTIHSAHLEKGRKVFQMFVCRVLILINAQLHPSQGLVSYTSLVFCKDCLPQTGPASCHLVHKPQANRHHNKRWSLVNRPPICQDKSKSFDERVTKKLMEESDPNDGRTIQNQYQ
jgi:hypothetical protein